MGVIAPISFLRRLDSLKATSALALGAVVYLIFIVIYYYANPTQPLPSKDEIQLINFTPQFLTTLPIFVFAFTCHQNIFSVYNELSDNGQSMLNRIITSSIGSAVVVYHIIGILGYLTFGKTTGSNIIQMYSPTLLVTIGRIAIVILVLFSFPLQCHPCRACLDKVLFAVGEYWKSTRFGKNAAYNSLTAHDTEDDHVHPHTPTGTADHGGSNTEISEFKYVAMTTGILIASYIIAISVKELEIVLSFVGSTGSTAVSFILPGSFYYKLHKNDPWTKRKILSVCLMIYGWLIMVVCLTANIRRVIKG
ncbi:hypothetical protein BGZ65_011571 [Modicella reniformis]|uniref:Amino acid transporter transmembrane domain-containing protein n=1 Tax=Modicella reniformis TaxID=1440133 RepID=A0A9P6IU47_9FUNG|nr:hypothetical protein BGZ65_011571 [Modicella reniformis]